MARARRAAPSRRWPILRTTMVAGAMIVAGAAGVVVGRLDSEQATGPSTSQPVGAGSSASSPRSSSPVTNGIPVPSAAPAAKACASEVATAEAVVAATRTAARHWNQHIQAWTDLLQEKNTNATAQAIFTQTTQAGPYDVKRLADADAAHTRTRGGCIELTGPARTACRQRMAALDAAAQPGHATSRDWQQHVAAMAASAAGKVSGVHARHAWEIAYRSAPKNLNAFATADQALARAPACNPG